MSDIIPLARQFDSAMFQQDSDAAAKILEEVGACGVKALHDASWESKGGYAPLSVDLLPDNKEKISVFHLATFNRHPVAYPLASVIVDRCDQK